MVWLFFGPPRSGKTYGGMVHLYEVFYKKKKTDRRFFYLNFNGFTYDDVNAHIVKNHLPYSVSKFKYTGLYSHLKHLWDLKVNQDVDDNELVEYCILHNLYNAVFYIDECQNYFRQQDKVLSWWLEYHGHLHQDIYLFTQNKTNIASTYRGNIERYEMVHATTLRLQKDVLRYSQYSGFAKTKDNFVRTYSHKLDPRVYKMYVSGDSVKDTPVFLIYLRFFIPALILTALIFYYLVYQVSPDVPESVSDPVPDRNVSYNSRDHSYIPASAERQEFISILLFCDRDSCSYEFNNLRSSYPYLYFESVVNTTDATVLYQTEILKTSSYTAFQLLLKINFNDLRIYFPDFYRISNNLHMPKSLDNSLTNSFNLIDKEGV